MMKCKYLIISLLVFLLFFSTVVSAETLSEGIGVNPESETVFAGENGVWAYGVELSVSGDYSVTITEIIQKLYNYDGEYFEYQSFGEGELQDAYKISPNKNKTFNGRLPSSNDIFFIDLTFIGKANTGKEVKGYTRIHLVKGQKNPEALSF